MTGDQEAIENGEMLEVVHAWFARALFDVHGQAQQELGGLLMGCPLWGDRFIRRFEVYCASSMLAPENARALQGARMVLFTDDDSVGRLVSIKRRIEGAGIQVLLRQIPPDLAARMGRTNQGKYLVLGAVHNIMVQMAARWGMGFHMLVPDHLYGERYFPSLKRLATKHHAIVQCSISANLVTAARGLERFRKPDGHLAAPGRKLCALAWRHLHPQMRVMVVTKKHDIDRRLPASTWLAWQGPKTLVVQSPHQHLAYLSPQFCRFAPSRVPHTMDAELPSFLPFGFYTAKPADDLAYIEVSGPDKAANRVIFSGEQWAHNLWTVLKFRDNYLPFLAASCEVPIGAHPGAMAIKEIDRQRGVLLNRFVAAKLSALEEWSQRMIDD